MDYLQTEPFQPTTWQKENIQEDKIPKSRVNLGRLPTPVHRFNIVLDGIEVFIKRDDFSSSDLSGNKVRKLEFLMADAMEQNCNAVITAGGLQSNHARATAVAARLLGMEPHLILRTPKPNTEIDLTGNLLWNRAIGSKIYTITPSNYGRIGSDNLIAEIHERLTAAGKRPYSIPVGGSNALGAFGYMETIKEIISLGVSFDHIVFACGSGGTAAGLAIGAKLSGLPSMLHAVGVCDNPKYFYDHIETVCNELGIDLSKHGNPKDWIKIYDGQGLGYAKSTTEELEYLVQVASRTGVVFDPVYSGKALFHFSHQIFPSNRDIFLPGHKVLIIHTGGVFGFYDKEQQVLDILQQRDIESFLQ